ncbi:site-specific recombinase XerD [Arthrobacter sp. UYNi723]
MVESGGGTWWLHFAQDSGPARDDGLLARVGRQAMRLDAGRPFFLDREGGPHDAGNGFFASGRMRNLAAGTNRKYAFALRTWFNFLHLRGKEWTGASDSDLFDYRFWRTSALDNPRRISGATWQGDLAAILAFHDWATDRLGADRLLPAAQKQAWAGNRTAVRDPRARASGIRAADVKWLSPGAFRLWRDVGIHGREPGGAEKTRWRPRSQTRDAAFVDGLYGTGLRIQELASICLIELPADGAAKAYATARLAGSCAKGGRSRRYWMGRESLDGMWNYVQTDRAAAIRRGVESGLYDSRAGRRIVQGITDRGLVRIVEPGGSTVHANLNDLSPADRSLLFIKGPDGLEPLALWLNEDGSPRAKRAWYKSFALANKRVRKAGIDRLECHPHMLRHSFALRWYAVGRLVWERRRAGAGSDRLEDFREQFGDTWSLVQTMLGHLDVNTTRNIYLEPFIGLDVEFLLAHSGDELSRDGVLAFLRSDPRVRLLDPGEGT